jgi:hypothetical protein
MKGLVGAARIDFSGKLAAYAVLPAKINVIAVRIFFISFPFFC